MVGRARRARSRTGRPGARGPVLGRVRRASTTPRAGLGDLDAKLLLAAGLDVAIIGPRESCTGDPARRAGNEYVFQSFAQANVATLEEAGVTKIVAVAAALLQHARERVPRLRRPLRGDAPFRVACEFVRDGRLAPVAGDAAITYHDSCYLARHNDVLAAPREARRADRRPLEMARSGRTTSAAAPAVLMWMEERGSQINEERAREAAATGCRHARGRVPSAP